MGLSIEYNINMFLNMFWFNMHTSYHKVMLLIQWKSRVFRYIFYSVYSHETNLRIISINLERRSGPISTCTKPGKRAAMHLCVSGVNFVHVTTIFRLEFKTTCTVKPVYAVAPIKQSPVFKCHTLFLSGLRKYHMIWTSFKVSSV
jgi:hypothetical protein